MKLYLLFILFFITAPVFSGVTEKIKSSNVIIEISDAIVNGGPVYILCFNSDKGFKSEKYFRIKLNSTILKSRFNITFHELPIGDYVFFAFQDTNGNGDLDEDVLEIPKEPFAISNFNNDISQELVFEKLKISFNGQSEVLTILKLNQY